MEPKSLKVVVPDQIWAVDHMLRMIPGVYLPARMTVLRLDSDHLALHSPVPMDDGIASRVAGLGDVSVIIAPNNYHHLFVSRTLERYPGAEFWAAPGLPTKRTDLTFQHLLGPDAAPDWGDVLTPFFLAGAPIADETVFVHRPTGTLVVSDSYFNLVSGTPGFLSPVMLRLLGAWKRPGQARLWRKQVKDRAAMVESTSAVLAQRFDRLVVAHGEIVLSGGHEAFTRATAWLDG